MASVVAIYNMALGHLGTRATVAATDESSVEARECTRHYATVRDELLRGFDWTFARRTELLTRRSETPPDGWTYIYAMPNLCARFHGIWTGPRPTGKPVSFEIANVADASGGADALGILSNQSPAWGRYTRVVENSELFGSGFTTALSWRLAEAVALSITNSASTFERVIRTAQIRTLEAKAADANEGITETDQPVPDWLAARGFTD